MKKEERLFHLQKHFSEKIMGMFAQGVPEELKEASYAFKAKTGISYKEAEKILEYTISQLQDKPLKFNP